MTDQFQFEIISPERRVFGDAKVVMVTIPGGEGDYGVLVGHAPLITTVRPGVVDIYEQNESSITDRIFVAGGFAEVTGERCTILAEEAMLLTDLDRTKLNEEAATLAEDIPLAKTDSERAALEMKLAVAQAKLEAIAA